MTTPSPKGFKFLKLSYAEKDQIWLTEQKTLRKLVGILGMLLPVSLFLFLFIDNGHASPLPSISHYYYTRVGSIFIIVVSLLAIFLLVYKGKEPIDFYLSSIAGLFALLLLLFPTDNISDICNDPANSFSVTILKKCGTRVIFHFVSAGIFLSCLAYMSFFLFTKSDKAASSRTDNKKARNKVFRVCGVMMAIAILVIVAGGLKIIHEPFYTDHHLTFWMEVLAVESFGISWLVKGEVIWGD